jgi:nicotinamide-nucleotide amidase
MAAGVLSHSNADVSVAITGIAGPTGGSEKKPVGLVVFARALRGQNPAHYFTQRVFFEGKDRAAIRHAATLFALNLLQPSGDTLRPSDDISMPAE